MYGNAFDLALIDALLQYLPHCPGQFVVRVIPYGKFCRLLDHDRMLPPDIREYESAYCDNADKRKNFRGIDLHRVLHIFRN